MLDICQEKVNDETEISVHLEMFDPCHYIDSSVTDYVCLNFPEDKYVSHSVILPPAGGKFKGILKADAFAVIVKAAEAAKQA